MSRPYNFSAGPAMLPEPVLRRAQEEMLDWHGSGMCVAEMSHRSKQFMSIAEQAESDLRMLLGCPMTIGCCSCKAVHQASSQWCR